MSVPLLLVMRVAIIFVVWISSNAAVKPTGQPTRQPSRQPTRQPTSQPTQLPTNPTGQPSQRPSMQPSRQPTLQPSSQPTRQPTNPTGQPSRQPTRKPTRQPSSQPSCQPTRQPTNPTGQPTRQPTRRPSRQPTRQPTSQPTRKPTPRPTPAPTSGAPTTRPTNPTAVPTPRPSPEPTPPGVPTPQPTASPTTPAPTSVKLSAAQLIVALSGVSGLSTRRLQELKAWHLSRRFGIDSDSDSDSNSGDSQYTVFEGETSDKRKLAVLLPAFTFRQALADFLQISLGMIGDPAVVADTSTQTMELLRQATGAAETVGRRERDRRVLQNSLQISVVVSGTSASVSTNIISSAMANPSALNQALTYAAGVPIGVSFVGVVDLSPTAAPTLSPTLATVNPVYIGTTAFLGTLAVIIIISLVLYYVYFIRARNGPIGNVAPRAKLGLPVLKDIDPYAKVEDHESDSESGMGYHLEGLEDDSEEGRLVAHHPNSAGYNVIPSSVFGLELREVTMVGKVYSGLINGVASHAAGVYDGVGGGVSAVGNALLSPFSLAGGQSQAQAQAPTAGIGSGPRPGPRP